MLSLHQRKGHKTLAQNSSSPSEKAMATYYTTDEIAFQLPFQLVEFEQVTTINAPLCINNFNDRVDGIVENIKKERKIKPNNSSALSLEQVKIRLRKCLEKFQYRYYQRLSQRSY